MGRMFLALALLGLMTCARGQEPRAVPPAADNRPLSDPTRPVSEIGPDYVVLQWFTTTPCETRAQIRQSDAPVTALRSPSIDLWADTKTVRTVNGTAGIRTFHSLRIEKLIPGKRYYWRIYDPKVTPTVDERKWGAAPPYRREYAVSTLAGPGRKTVIRVPVKVLLMPNVVDVASAHRKDGPVVPPPPRLTERELARVREEYAVAARFFFINSGMRYFPDFHFFMDDRYQRWGELPPVVDPVYKDWPICRSYDGVPFRDPGGGRVTIVDTKDPTRTVTEPIVESPIYSAQIEQAFVRRYNEDTHRWEFQTSGGGTYGPDEFPKGIPGRSQYFGGAGDIAWLTAHEYHHQMEGQGEYSFANREDDRIVFDHPAPRRFPDNAWTTAGRHGEQWDVLAFWDRTLTSAQWLRLYFGETLVTDDADNDGVPDDDPRLPFDEKRWGSDRRKFATDGRMRDLDKLMLTTLAPAPLQRSDKKPAPQYILPDPKNPDTDGDGIPDNLDPYPLYPYPPFLYPLTARIDGDASEWRDIPVAGKMEKGGITLTFQQAHDDSYYYGLLTVRGPWRRIRLNLDGEGQGLFAPEGLIALQFTQFGALPPEIKTVAGDGSDLLSKVGTDTSGNAVFEFAVPNRGAAKWFWDGGGHEIGASLEVTDNSETSYSVYEPYRLFYATMLERTGLPILPPHPPEELTAEKATVTLRPGSAPQLALAGKGWTRDGDLLRHTGADEGVAYLDHVDVMDFDLWIRFEGRHDGILGAFLPETKGEEMDSNRDYIAFVGGYDNTVTRLRLFGRETGDSDQMLTPGEHTMQLTRRNGEIWCLLDGKPILYGHDSRPNARVARLAILGGYNGAQTIKEIRARY